MLIKWVKCTAGWKEESCLFRADESENFRGDGVTWGDFEEKKRGEYDDSLMRLTSQGEKWGRSIGNSHRSSGEV